MYWGRGHDILVKKYCIVILFALTVGLISSAPLSTSVTAYSSFILSDDGIPHTLLMVQGAEVKNKTLIGQTQTTLSQNSSIPGLNQNGTGGTTPITPIPYSGTVWNYLGPIGTRNFPTLSTATGAACSGDQGGDSDGDAICDKWESPTTPGNDATHRYITCPTAGGVPLDSQCSNTNAKYNLCFNDQYADVWGSVHRSGDPICPKVGHKDIFVEIDYMLNHHPDDTAIRDVIKAFGNAPITPQNTASDDFNRLGGITLHVVLDEQLQRVNPIWAWQDNGGIDDLNYVNDFKSINERHFGLFNNPANIGNPSDERAPCPPTSSCDPNLIRGDLPLLLKHYVYHYALYAVTWIGSPVVNCGPSGTPSGTSETLGNDIIVSLGCNFGPSDPLGGTVGTKNQQAGTLMHELGHNLNLGHGGPVLSSFGSSNYNTNCKPNELSVMSYSRQVPATVSDSIWESYHFLDYSSSAVKTIANSDPKEGTPPPPSPPGPPNDNTPRLVEPDGLATGRPNVIVYGTPYLVPPTRTATLPTGSGGIDWNGSSGIIGTVYQDVNNFGIANCVESVGASPDGQIHKSMDEWNNLQYYFLNDGDGRDGLTVPSQLTPETELTGDMVQKLTKQANEFSGLLPPISSNGSSSFKVGDIIPVKFQLRDENGSYIDNAKVTFTAERINGSNGSKFNNSVSGSPTTLFQNNIANNTYAYDWNTSELQDGAWAIRCVINFGAKHASTLQAASPIPSGMSGTLILKP